MEQKMKIHVWRVNLNACQSASCSWELDVQNLSPSSVHYMLLLRNKVQVARAQTFSLALRSWPSRSQRDANGAQVAPVAPECGPSFHLLSSGSCVVSWKQFVAPAWQTILAGGLASPGEWSLASRVASLEGRDEFGRELWKLIRCCGGVRAQRWARGEYVTEPVSRDQSLTEPLNWRASSWTGRGGKGARVSRRQPTDGGGYGRCERVVGARVVSSINQEKFVQLGGEGSGGGWRCWVHDKSGTSTTRSEASFTGGARQGWVCWLRGARLAPAFGLLQRPPLHQVELVWGQIRAASWVQDRNNR